MDRHHASNGELSPIVNGFSHRRPAHDDLSALSDSSQTDHEPSGKRIDLYEATSNQTNFPHVRRRGNTPVPDIRNDTRQSGGIDEAQSLRLSTDSNDTQKPDGRSREESLTARPNVRPVNGLTQTHSVSAMSLLDDRGHNGQRRSQSPSGSPPQSLSRSAIQGEERQNHGLERNRISPHSDSNDIRHSHIEHGSPRNSEASQNPENREELRERSSRSLSSTSKLSIARDLPSPKPINGLLRSQGAKDERTSVSITYDAEPEPRNSSSASLSFTSLLAPPKAGPSSSRKGYLDQTRSKSPTPTSGNKSKRAESPSVVVSNSRRIPELPSSKADSRRITLKEQSNDSAESKEFASDLLQEGIERPTLSRINRAHLQRAGGQAVKRQVRSSVALEPISLRDSDMETFDGECFTNRMNFIA